MFLYDLLQLTVRRSQNYTVRIAENTSPILCLAVTAYDKIDGSTLG